MYKYEFTQIAKDDLRSVMRYITRELDNKKAASDLKKKVRSAVERLCLFPESGALVKHEYNSVGSRFVRCKNYLVFYHIEGEIIKVDRILYGRQDYMTLLFGRSDLDDE